MFKVLLLILVGFIFNCNVNAQSNIKITVDKSNSITKDLGAYDESYGWILPDSYVFAHKDGYLFVDFVYTKTDFHFSDNYVISDGYQAKRNLNVYSVDFNGNLITEKSYDVEQKDYKIFVKNGDIYLVYARGYENVVVEKLNKNLEMISREIFDSKEQFYFRVGNIYSEIIDLYVTDDAYYLYHSNSKDFSYVKLDLAYKDVTGVASTDDVYSDCESNTTNLYGINADEISFFYNPDKDITVYTYENDLKGIKGNYSDTEELVEINDKIVFETENDKYVSYSDLVFYSDYFILIAKKDRYSINSEVNDGKVAGFKADILFYDYDGNLLYTFENDSAVLNYNFDGKNMALTSLSVEGICNLNSNIGIQYQRYEDPYILESYNGCTSNFSLDTYAVNIENIDVTSGVEEEKNPDTNDIIILTFIILIGSTAILLLYKSKNEC